LRYVILPEEVADCSSLPLILQGVLCREEVACQWFIGFTLWRVCQLRNGHRLLGLVISESPKQLVFVNESQFCTRGIHVDLMNQHVGDLTVFDGRDEQKDDGDHHSWEHRWIALIERVFLYQVVQDGDWNRIFHV